jgi:hypothetical protein
MVHRVRALPHLRIFGLTMLRAVAWCYDQYFDWCRLFAALDQGDRLKWLNPEPIASLATGLRASHRCVLLPS